MTDVLRAWRISKRSSNLPVRPCYLRRALGHVSVIASYNKLGARWTVTAAPLRKIKQYFQVGQNLKKKISFVMT